TAPADLETAVVAFGQPDVETVMRSRTLRWVQLDSAGYERYDRDDLRRHLREHDLVITNSSRVYAQPCAEHLLAMIFALARQLPGAMAAQSGDHSWPMATLRAESRLLQGQRALLLGYGTIGRTVAALLGPLEMKLSGYRRHPDGQEGIPMVGESGLAPELAQADHVINILPASPTTRGFCNGAFFGQMKRGAIFYNIGRGVTVDQEALLVSLQSGHLAAAALDVTDPEPLPPEHPLWKAPNCLITPHTAGGHGREKEVLIAHFLTNLRRYQAGEPLADRILG
ncbi:MAG: D-2-hydroxyacid dehydrogenase, partial [Acidobacteriota bacterium]